MANEDEKAAEAYCRKRYADHVLPSSTEAYLAFAAGVARAKGHAATDKLRGLQRHDPSIVSNSSPGAHPYDSEIEWDRSDSGEWVKWSDVEELAASLAGAAAPEETPALLTQVCKSCGYPIQHTGKYWEHTTYTPKHPALPASPDAGRGEMGR